MDQDRIQINGVWYVKEKESLLPTRKELEIIYFEGCVLETDEYCWEVNKLRKNEDGDFYDGVDIKFTDKTQYPLKTDHWDGTEWLLSVLEGEYSATLGAKEEMSETGIRDFKILLQKLKDKNWL